MTPRTIKYLIASIFSFVFPLIANAALQFESGGADYIFIRAGTFIGYTIDLLLGIATIVFFWGVIQYVIAQGDEKKIAEGRKYMLWGIIGLVVIASSWGLANLIIFTIFGETSFSIPLLGFGLGGGRQVGRNEICLGTQIFDVDVGACIDL